MVTVYRENSFTEIREDIVEILNNSDIDIDNCAFIVAPENFEYIEDAEIIAEKLSELDMSVVCCYGDNELYRVFAVVIE